MTPPPAAALARAAPRPGAAARSPPRRRPAPAEQARRNDARLVQDQDVAGLDELDDVAEDGGARAPESRRTTSSRLASRSAAGAGMVRDEVVVESRRAGSS
jgi:hypothetical protein